MAAVELIIRAIQSVPEIIWAALLGSLLTLVGVVLNNRHHRAEQNAQREHDSREQERERKFEARVDVYLAAAGEIVKAQQHLGSLANVDLRQFDLGEALSGFAASANQAILIATDETAEAINEFLSVYMTALFRLLPRVFPIQTARSDRDIHQTMYDTYQAEVKSIIATMTHRNETHTGDQVDWDALNRSLEFNQKQATEAVELRDKAWDEINRLNMEYMDALMGEAKVITRAALPAMVAIRSDLEISSDIDRYRIQFEKRLALMEGLIRGFKQELQAAVT